MRSAWLLAGLVAGTPALAQSPGGQPDNAALLKALQQLQREISDLKAQRGGTASPAAAPVAAPANGAAPPAPAASPPLPKKAVPGWAVKLIPWSDDQNAPYVSWFPGPLADFTFDLHSRLMPGQNRFIYNPGAFFRVPEAGTYTFSVFLETIAAPHPTNQYASLATNCATEFFVDGNKVVSGGTSFDWNLPRPEKDIYRGQSFYGQVALEERDYKLDFKVDCWFLNERKTVSYDAGLPVWKRNRFKVLVKAPADAIPRAFRPQELFFVGQPD